jgi:hypothetical protein
MDTNHDRHCAELLVAMDLQFVTMAECLMGELGLTYDEAATSLLTAQARRCRELAAGLTTQTTPESHSARLTGFLNRRRAAAV